MPLLSVNQIIFYCITQAKPLEWKWLLCIIMFLTFFFIRNSEFNQGFQFSQWKALKLRHVIQLFNSFRENKNKTLSNIFSTYTVEDHIHNVYKLKIKSTSRIEKWKENRILWPKRFGLSMKKQTDDVTKTGFFCCCSSKWNRNSLKNEIKKERDQKQDSVKRRSNSQTTAIRKNKEWKIQ